MAEHQWLIITILLKSKLIYKPNFGTRQNGYQVQWCKLNSNQVAIINETLSLLDHLNLRAFPSELSERHIQCRSSEMTEAEGASINTEIIIAKKGRVSSSIR